MNGKCNVFNCPGRMTTHDDVTFHYFPMRDPKLLKIWHDKVHLKTEITEKSRICSLHFEDRCFRIQGNSKVLNPGSIPLEYKVRKLFQKSLNIQLIKSFLSDKWRKDPEHKN